MRLGAAFLLAMTLGQAQSNKRLFDSSCPTVWAGAIRAMIGNDFTPAVLDKDSGVATFTYPKGIPINSQWGQRKAADAILNQFATTPAWGKGYFGAVLVQMRVDSASLLLSERDGGCEASLKFAYSVFVKGRGWYVLESNSAFESRILEALGGGKSGSPRANPPTPIIPSPPVVPPPPVRQN